MNKYVLVTGSSGGIGKEVVKDLINKGYYVIGIDLVDSKFENNNFKFYKCNLQNFTDIESLLEKVKSITNHLDAIYNLAGIFELQTMLEGSDEDLKKIIDINFFGVYKINKTLLPLLDKQSRIIVFSSECARYSPQPFNGYYALSKIIVDKYADVLRRELNYLDIKVIKVQTGAIKTKLLEGVNDKYQMLVDSTPYHKKPLIKLKKLMDNEINKQLDPHYVSIRLAKLMDKKHPKLLYKIKNSFKLRFLNALPEKIQDFIYVRVIK